MYIILRSVHIYSNVAFYNDFIRRLSFCITYAYSCFVINTLTKVFKKMILLSIALTVPDAMRKL